MKSCLVLLCFAALGWAQTVMPIWPDGAPGSEKYKDQAEKPAGAGDFERVTNVHRPTLTVYLPEKTNGTAVVVMPGGGHRHLAVEHEGRNVAKALNALGVAAFVLKYRLAKAEGSTYSVEEHALADAKRALRVVRHHAADWGLRADRIGVMGFSAGGELALLAATQYDNEMGVSSRPDFQVLVYPGGLQRSAGITKETPPGLLLVAGDDNIARDYVIGTYGALQKTGVAAEMHVFESGGHGFGIKPGAKSVVARTWMARVEDWLRARGLL